jgi:hypothetical protein
VTTATTGDLFAALFTAHQAGDYWAQTNAQAAAKGLPGNVGRRACAAHVASMTACKAGALAVLHVSGRRVNWPRAAVALAADAATHYVADRRRPLERLAGMLEDSTGKLTFYRLGAPRPGHDDNPGLGTGAAALDQAWHIAWLWVAAVIAASEGGAP